jgi:methionyl-tRNA formyltransferase
MVLGADAALETLHGLADGTLHPVDQPSGFATNAPKIFPKDCIVNFNQPVDQVHNFIRGLSPYPAAYTEVSGHHLKLLRSHIAPDAPQGILPGAFRISEDSKRIFFGTSTDALEITELQREGKRAMSTEEFLRGNAALFHLPNS